MAKRASCAICRWRGKDLTLIGAGAGSGGTIFDGGQVDTDSAVVNCLEPTIELQHLSITGGSGWPALITANETVTLSDVTVTGNSSDGAAGAIYNLGSALILNAGTHVTGNAASNADFGGGGILTDGGSVTLNSGSRVSGNDAVNGSGGGIFSLQGTVILNAGSEVTENTASVTGGGIYNCDGTVMVNAGSNLSNNSAPPGTPNDCFDDCGGTGCP